MTNHVMIDLETISTRKRAVIVSIGIATFDGLRITGTHLLLPEVQPQIAAGRHVDFGTIQWWIREASGAIDTSFLAPDTGRLHVGVMQGFLKSIIGPDGLVWGNGSDFDISILETYLEDFGFGAPWSYRNVRDVRTLRMLRPEIRPTDPSVRHDPVSDAVSQANHVMTLMASLGLAPEWDGRHD